MGEGVGGAWTVCRFNRERAGQEKGMMFLRAGGGGGGGVIPQCTLQDKTK